MDNKILYIHAMEYYSAIKRMDSEICCDIDDTCCAETASINSHMLHDAIYIKCPE